MKQGRCTLVIAMLDVIPDGDLPNPPEGPLYGTDVATFRELKYSADNILLECVVMRHGAGYRVAGRSPEHAPYLACRRLVDDCLYFMLVGEWDSLGVLILSTESYENRVIPTGVRPAFLPAFDLPNVLNQSDSKAITA